MLIIDADVVRKVDENRGDMSRAEFLNFLIDSQFKEETGNQHYVDKEEFRQFTQGMKELLRNFLEFFISYGLELGKQPQDKAGMRNYGRCAVALSALLWSNLWLFRNGCFWNK